MVAVVAQSQGSKLEKLTKNWPKMIDKTVDE